MFKILMSVGLMCSSTIIIYNSGNKEQMNREFVESLEEIDDLVIEPHKARICTSDGKYCIHCNGNSQGFSCTLTWPEGYCVGGCENGCGGTCHWK